MRIFRLAIVALIVLTVTQIVQSAEIAKEKITLAYAAISPSMSALWMAKEIGAFDKNGLNADLVYISSGATTIQALVGGSVQAALGASNAVVAATLKGAPIIAVGGNSSRPGMQLWVQPEIQRAEQLAGEGQRNEPSLQPLSHLPPLPRWPPMVPEPAPNSNSKIQRGRPLGRPLAGWWVFGLLSAADGDHGAGVQAVAVGERPVRTLSAVADREDRADDGHVAHRVERHVQE